MTLVCCLHSASEGASPERPSEVPKPQLKPRPPVWRHSACSVWVSSLPRTQQSQPESCVSLCLCCRLHPSQRNSHQVLQILPPEVFPDSVPSSLYLLLLSPWSHQHLSLGTGTGFLMSLSQILPRQSILHTGARVSFPKPRSHTIPLLKPL